MSVSLCNSLSCPLSVNSGYFSNDLKISLCNMCVCMLVSMGTTRANANPELRMCLTGVGSNTDLMESSLSHDNMKIA